MGLMRHVFKQYTPSDDRYSQILERVDRITAGLLLEGIVVHDIATYRKSDCFKSYWERRHEIWNSSPIGKGILASASNRGEFDSSDMTSGAVLLSRAEASGIKASDDRVVQESLPSNAF